MYSQESYHSTLEQLPTEAEVAALTERVYAQVFRTDFTAPGFALVSLRQAVVSASLRRFMVMLKEALAVVHRQKQGRSLNYLSLMHFDQQNTTKFHLDGGPEESYLMLGYEPSEVESVLHMADYTRAAQDLNITPHQFLRDYNPIFTRGEQLLAAYTTRVEGFTVDRAQVLLVNNSSLPFSSDGMSSLGVLHQATIVTPDPTKSRIINSTMLAPSEEAGDRVVSLAMQQDFLATSV